MRPSSVSISFEKTANKKLNPLSDQPSSGLKPGDSRAIRQLLTHVPDIVIKCDHKTSMPRVNHVRGVCMFADISGETGETYILYWQTGL